MNEPDILREIGALREAVTNTSKNVDNLRVENADQHKAIKGEITDVKKHVQVTNHRLTTLETWKAEMRGFGMALKAEWPLAALILGLVGGYVLEKLWG